MNEVEEGLSALQAVSGNIRTSRKLCKVCNLGPDARSEVEHEIQFSTGTFDEKSQKLKQKGIWISRWSLETHKKHLNRVQAIEKYEEEVRIKSQSQSQPQFQPQPQPRSREESIQLVRVDNDKTSIVQKGDGFTPTPAIPAIPAMAMTSNRILNDIHKLDAIINRLDDPMVLEHVKVADVLQAIRLKADLFGDLHQTDISIEASITIAKILAQVKKEEITKSKSAPGALK